MRLLFATDGSPAATHAGRWVAELPWATQPNVDVVTVVPERIRYQGPAGRRVEPNWGLLDRIRAEEEAAAQKILDDGVATFAGWSTPVQSTIERGHPATEIVRLAKERGSDWVVLGEQGVTETNRFPLGAVSLAVLRLSPCAVLLVSPGAPVPQSLLVATDFSEAGDLALTAAGTLPLAADARALVLHVFEEHPFLKEPSATASADVKRLLIAMRETQEETVRALLVKAEEQLRSRGWQTTVEVREGPAATEILGAAADHHVDWIVIGTRGLSSPPDLPLGSVCQRIALANPSALLVVR